MTKISALFAGLLMLTAAAGCDHIKNSIDCHGICQRYSDCFDKSYDVDSCTNKCEDNANSDKDFMSKADDCDSCLGDKSCASATFNCATECAGIVP